MLKKILIKNGVTYDPLLDLQVRRDVAVSGGRIVPAEGFEPEEIFNAENCLVTPGLIDFHVHSWNEEGRYDIDVFCIPNGVTTCVDAGSCGVSCMEQLLEKSRGKMTRMLALMHFASEGQLTLPHPENQTPAAWAEDRICELMSRYPDRIVGFKLRQQDELQQPYGLRAEHVAAGARLARKLGRRLVVHVNNPIGGVGETAALLDKGDVYCHVYAGTRENILDESGCVRQEILDARRRGVLFDAANGRRNFLFRVAVPAIRQGFLPDIIGSDVNPGCYYENPLTTLPRILSKYMAMGMTLPQVLRCATLAPARWLGHEEWATLAPGSEANLAVFRLKEKHSVFFDTLGESLEGGRILVPQMTIARGSVAYCQTDFMN